MTTDSSSKRWRSVGATALVLAAAGGLTLPLWSARDPGRALNVSDEIRREALASSRTIRPSMTDEIEYYEARAEARDGETFALERLFGARMLAHRAYGGSEHLTEAARVVDRLRSRDPDRPEALRAESSLHLARHDFREALGAARALDQISGGRSASATYRLFDALWAVGEHGEAREVLDRRLDTLSTAYLSRRARVLDAEGLVEPARDLFRRVVTNVGAYAESKPIQAWALVELGHFELHGGDAGEAVRRYREALRTLPASPAAIEGLAAVSYGVDRDLESARWLYRKALQVGAHREIKTVLADIEEALGDHDAAVALRDSFVAEATESPESERLYARRLALLMSADPETTAEALRLARLDLSQRRDPGSLGTLAWVHFRMGEVELAWVLAERSTSMAVPPPPLAYMAGVIAAAAGEPTEAERLLQEALEGRVELAPAEEAEARRILGGLG